MSEWYDGWVYLGADGRPVVRNDGSRIGFRFADAARLTQQLAAAPQEETADGSNRRALAPLDSRFNKDWDPQRPKSTLADMTKWTRLLAYHLVQTTEPEEAVRRAVAMIFGNPVTMEERGEKLWVPTQYDAKAVKSLAGTLLRQAVGAGSAKGDGLVALGGAAAGNPLPTARTIRGVPLDGRGLGQGIIKIDTIYDNSAGYTGGQLAQVQSHQATEKLPPNDQKIDTRLDREQSNETMQERRQSASADEAGEDVKDMDRLSFRNALAHYAKGKGQPIRIPLSSLDLSGVSASQTFGGVIDAERSYSLPGEDGRTIGTITLRLVGPDTVVEKAGYDDYDFDLKLEKRELERDAKTALGYLVNEGYALINNAHIKLGPGGGPVPWTKGGTPYRIYLDGEAKIKP